MPTSACAGFIESCRRRWDGLSYQVFNRRRIAGTSTWSQHAYGNAVDIFGPKAKLDQVARYARGWSHTRNVLWQVRNHYDHVHVDFEPPGRGTPPRSDPRPGGVTSEGWAERMTVIRRGWSHPHVATLQALLNGAAEVEGLGWPRLKVDGDFGGHTHNVLLMFQHSRGLTTDGIVGPATWTKLLALG